MKHNVLVMVLYYRIDRFDDRVCKLYRALIGLHKGNSSSF